MTKIIYVTGEVYTLNIKDEGILYCYQGDREGDIAFKDPKDGTCKIFTSKNYLLDIDTKAENYTRFSTDLWTYIDEIEREDEELITRATSHFLNLYNHYYNAFFTETHFKHMDIFNDRRVKQ